MMLKPEDVVFILVDVQGKLAELMHKKEQLFKNLEILIKGMKILEIPIIWAEQYPEGLGETVPELKELLTDYQPISKKSFSVMGHRELEEKITSYNREEAIVAGIESHVCVYQTVSDLLSDDFGVTVIADAISSRRKANKILGLQRMLSDGARLSSVEMILFELLQSAEGDKFKAIAKLVK
jgi:nicotinamidase-related amidase